VLKKPECWLVEHNSTELNINKDHMLRSKDVFLEVDDFSVYLKKILISMLLNGVKKMSS
jgi:hypothetical protein